MYVGGNIHIVEPRYEIKGEHGMLNIAYLMSSVTGTYICRYLLVEVHNIICRYGI